MIIVSVTLHSAVDGRVQELARMHIANDGTGTAGLSHYNVTTFRGRSAAQLDRGTRQRSGRVENYPRNDLHVWHLVARALHRIGYGLGN